MAHAASLPELSNFWDQSAATGRHNLDESRPELSFSTLEKLEDPRRTSRSTMRGSLALDPLIDRPRIYLYSAERAAPPGAISCFAFAARTAPGENMKSPPPEPATLSIFPGTEEIFDSAGRSTVTFGKVNEEFDPSAVGEMPFRRVSANLDLIITRGTCNFCPWRECDTSLGVKNVIRSG